MVKFGYIMDCYPTTHNNYNLFLDYLKKITNWTKHYSEKEFQEEFFEMSEEEVESHWKEYKKIHPWACERFKQSDGTIPIYTQETLPRVAYLKLRG